MPPPGKPLRRATTALARWAARAARSPAACVVGRDTLPGLTAAARLAGDLRMIRACAAFRLFVRQ
jgi:hypothetical protein